MKIANIKIFDQPKPSEKVPGMRGFMFVGKKLIDQLSIEYEQIQSGRLDKSRMQNLDQVTPILKQMSNILYGNDPSVHPEQRLDKIINYYNLLRPDALKLHHAEYKKFTKDLAAYQISKILDYIDLILTFTRVYDRQSLLVWGNRKFYELYDDTLNILAVIYGFDTSRSKKDIVIILLTEYLKAIDQFLCEVSQENILSDFLTKKTIRQLSTNGEDFENYFIALFEFYQIEGQYHPACFSYLSQCQYIIQALVLDYAEFNRDSNCACHCNIETVYDFIISELEVHFRNDSRTSSCSFKLSLKNMFDKNTLLVKLGRQTSDCAVDHVHATLISLGTLVRWF